jgi:hypothetical protein
MERRIQRMVSTRCPFSPAQQPPTIATGSMSTSTPRNRNGINPPSPSILQETTMLLLEALRQDILRVEFRVTLRTRKPILTKPPKAQVGRPSNPTQLWQRDYKQKKMRGPDQVEMRRGTTKIPRFHNRTMENKATKTKAWVRLSRRRAY